MSLLGANKEIWGCLEEYLAMQQAGISLRPAISKAVKDEKGELCKTQAKCHRTHFQSIESDFDMNVVEAVRQRQLRIELDIAPTQRSWKWPSRVGRQGEEWTSTRSD